MTTGTERLERERERKREREHTFIFPLHSPMLCHTCIFNELRPLSLLFFTEEALLLRVAMTPLFSTVLLPDVGEAWPVHSSTGKMQGSNIL